MNPETPTTTETPTSTDAATSSEYRTILLDVDATDRVATLTLNRPERLNAFDRTMCEEVRDAWHRIRLDDSVNAVVLRAAGPGGVSGGGGVKVPNREPPGKRGHQGTGAGVVPELGQILY
ncbi:enoyl-CoA hydratase/isomerase family protein, partial [Nocardia abscessus]|uniref:enoyl-CoA hydratase/isomerase family protein n=1 Tax=Nocardia abscessus TaxID=120957 RepID=UPI002453A5E8